MKPGDPLGVLLAGGRSSRMHADKSAVRLGEDNLALWAAAVLESVAPENIQVGGGSIEGLDWPRMPDLRTECGPAAGIEAGLTAAHAIQAGGVPIAVLAIDIPFVSQELLRSALESVARGASIVAPRWQDRWHPLCAAYAPGMLEPLQARLDAGDLDLQGFLDEWAIPIGGKELRAFGDPDQFLLNVNTPEDLRQAEKLLRSNGQE